MRKVSAKDGERMIKILNQQKRKDDKLQDIKIVVANMLTSYAATEEFADEVFEKVTGKEFSPKLAEQHGEVMNSAYKIVEDLVQKLNPKL